MTKDKRYLFWVEDEKYAQEGFGKMLSLGEYEILSIAKSQASALSAFKEYQDEIIIALIDLYIPKNEGETDIDPNNGYFIAKKIRETGIPVVILTFDLIPELLVESLKDGISYLMKRDVTEHVLIEALELAMTGCGIYSRLAFGELTKTMINFTTKDPLSEEQWILLEARISGKSIKEIAEEKPYAPSTISNKFTEIYSRIGVSNQIEALRWYQRNAKKYNRPETNHDS